MSSSRFLYPPLAIGLALLVAPVFAAEPLKYSNGDFSLRVSGRVQGDALLGASVPSENTDNFLLRRARIGVTAQWGEDWRARVSADVAHGLRLQDAAVEYRGWPVWLEAGRIGQPFGLAQQTSSRDQPFMERPQATVLGTSYGLGVSANYRGDRWALTAGVFGHPGGGASSDDDYDDEGERIRRNRPNAYDRAVAARVTYTPIRNDEWLLHLGGGLSWNQSEDGTVRFRGSPESRLLQGLTVRSAELTGVDHVLLSNLEIGLRHGPVLVTAEAIQARVDTRRDPSPRFDSWYVEGSWALTGEQRAYSRRQGVFGGITPAHPFRLGQPGWGAVELTARYSATDLSDPRLGGDKGRVASVGVNWTPIDSWRVQLDVLDIERTRRGETKHDNAVQMRLQYSF